MGIASYGSSRLRKRHLETQMAAKYGTRTSRRSSSAELIMSLNNHRIHLLHTLNGYLHISFVLLEVLLQGLDGCRL